MVAIEPGTAQLLPSQQWNMTNMLHCNRGCLIIFFAGWSSLVARRAHNPKVVGSNPTPATNQRSPGQSPPSWEGFPVSEAPPSLLKSLQMGNGKMAEASLGRDPATDNSRHSSRTFHGMCPEGEAVLLDCGE